MTLVFLAVSIVYDVGRENTLKTGQSEIIKFPYFLAGGTVKLVFWLFFPVNLSHLYLFLIQGIKTKSKNSKTFDLV